MNDREAVTYRHEGRETYGGRKFLTVEEVGKELRIGRTNAYQLAKEPGFPVLKIGKQLRIPADDFYDWLRSRMNNNH